MTAPYQPPQHSNPIQLIQVLTEIQDRRQQMSLQQQQLDEQRKHNEQTAQEAAARLGFEKGSKNLEQITAAIQHAGNMAPEARTALLNSYASSGEFKPEEIAALGKLFPMLPTTPETARSMAVTMGQDPGASPVNREAYIGATTGMNAGQLAGSELNARTNNAMNSEFQQLTPDAIGQLAREYFAKGLAGRPPEEVAMGDALINGKDDKGNPSLPRAAAVKYGLQPSANVEGQIAAQYADIRLRSMQDMNQFIAEITKLKTTQGSLTAEQRVQALGKMSEIAGKMQTSQSESQTNAQLATWNGIAAQLDEPDLMIHSTKDAPQASSLINKVLQKSGYFSPPTPQSIMPQGQPQGQQLPFSAPSAGMPQTPWMPRP